MDALSPDPRFVHRHRDPATGATHLGTRSGVEHRIPCVDGPLWSHQAEAIDALVDRESVVVATPTASGKSACYQIPALHSATQGTTTLVVYPTKALAHDQLRSLAGAAPEGVVVAAYDGDCSAAERAWVRDHADIVLTNPEMLHLGILANHRRWDRFLSRLDLVVVDEIHALRGTFGSHVAHLTRRLRRLVRARRGTEVRFAFTSATIGGPDGLANTLAGLPVRLVETSGAPSGNRTTVLWNPFSPDALTGSAASRAGSLNHETATVAAELVAHDLATLVFCRSRRGAEVVANQVRALLEDHRKLAGTHGTTRPKRVRTYRAGYLSEERREIELDLTEGRLDCVVATNALELGVDIDGLDAVVLSGFPGTISSFRQQCGRVGRNGADSLAVLVAGEDQLDQWMMRHPRELFRRPPEPVVVNPDNHHVLLPHIGCAADEMPLRHRDDDLWGESLDDAVRALVIEDRLTLVDPPPESEAARTGERWAVWSGRGAPAPTVSLRSASRGEYEIRRLDGSLVGTVDAARAELTVHPDAVYLHQGLPWRVLELDHGLHTAVVEPDDGLTYTQTRTTTDIRIVEHLDRTVVGALEVGFGRVEVTTRLTGFVRRSTDTHELLEHRGLEAEPTVLDTDAMWWVFAGSLVESTTRPDTLPGALHAAEHAGIGILPLFALCDRWDLGGVSTVELTDTGLPTVVIHDALPGGSGVSALAFNSAQRHLEATLDVLVSCPCERGCPSCVQSPKCGNGNEPLDKAAATALLAAAVAPGTMR
ncbi:MAG: DEAD/DEAH box helicase [Microthrixaceae bacterium]